MSLFSQVHWTRANDKIMTRSINWCEVICKPKQTHVYYINGILTSLDSAMRSGYQLRSVMLKDPYFQDNTSWAVAYNPSHSLRDLLEARSQQTSEEEFADFLENKFHLINSEGNEQNRKNSFQNISEEHSELFELILTSSNKDVDFVNTELVNQIKLGRKVLLISHSQGNFFANQAYAYIRNSFSKFPNAKLANIQLASPALFNLSQGPHFTRVDDAIIRWVDRISKFREQKRPLPANLTASVQGDWLGHYFLESYLFDPKLEEQLITASKSELNKLSQDPFEDPNKIWFTSAASESPEISSQKVFGIKTNLSQGSDMDLIVLKPQSDPNSMLEAVKTSIPRSSQNQLIQSMSCPQMRPGLYRIGVQFRDPKPSTRFGVSAKFGTQQFFSSSLESKGKEEHWAFQFQLVSLVSNLELQNQGYLILGETLPSHNKEATAISGINVTHAYADQTDHCLGPIDLGKTATKHLVTEEHR